MATFEDSTFEDQALVIDGNDYIGCTFRRCQLVYTGAAGGRLERNNFYDCRWVMDGPAARTLQFLAALYQGGAKDLVDKFMDDIKSGRVLQR